MLEAAGFARSFRGERDATLINFGLGAGARLPIARAMLLLCRPIHAARLEFLVVTLFRILEHIPPLLAGEAVRPAVN